MVMRTICYSLRKVFVYTSFDIFLPTIGTIDRPLDILLPVFSCALDS